MPGVTLFLDFAEDGRWSMENYARQLASHLGSEAGGRWAVREFRPRFEPVRRLPRRWADRFNRYIAYPRQALAAAGDLNHIIDHGYAHLLSKLPAERTIVTVHDMMPILAARGLVPGIRHRRPWLSEHSASFLRRARAIVAVSESTRADIIRHLGVAPERVRTVHNGLSTAFRPLAEDKSTLRARFGLSSSRHWILITGGQWYKNHLTSVRVLAALRAEGHDVSMVCMGDLPADARQAVVSSNLDSHIVRIRPDQDEELVALYNAVDCLLFPSHYEGFGWPPLESMACGTPVVASNAASLPEVTGGAALLAEPRDVESLRGLVARVLWDRKEAEALRAKGLARASEFTWRKHATAVLRIYDECLGVAPAKPR